MNSFHLPVPFDRPESTILRQFFALLEAQAGRPPFILCIMNYRVSACMYHYLRLQRNYSVQAARSPILEQWQMEPQWRAVMRPRARDLNLNPSASDGNP